MSLSLPHPVLTVLQVSTDYQKVVYELHCRVKSSRERMGVAVRDTVSGRRSISPEEGALRPPNRLPGFMGPPAACGSQAEAGVLSGAGGKYLPIC